MSPSPAHSKSSGDHAPHKPITKTSLKGLPHYLVESLRESSSQADKEEEERDVNARSKLQDRLDISNANLPIEWEKPDSRDSDYEGLAILNLAHNHISDLLANLPCLCPKLTRLDLSHNAITSVSLPRGFPSGLKHLSLSFNPLGTVDCEAHSFRPLPCTSPQAITDAGSELTIDSTTFCLHRQHNSLPMLGVLEMSSCELTSVNFYRPLLSPRRRHRQRNAHSAPETFLSPSGVGSSGRKRVGHSQSHAHSLVICPLITRLVLSENRLAKVPESVCEMVSLNSLDLSNNDIIDLPADLGRLSNLWEFPLNGLKLISPPHNIIERGKTKDIIGFLWSLLQRLVRKGLN